VYNKILGNYTVTLVDLNLAYETFLNQFIKDSKIKKKDLFKHYYFEILED
jgi:hypothetical protein